MAKANVTMIPASRNRNTFQPISDVRKRRVAGYARVSTDSDEQATSYEAQVDYYTNFIKGRPDWEFVKVYTDEGISGVSTAHRDGFKKMIADALSGRIDLIVTKSVSRFARNTVDSLTTVRKLKEKGVEVFFQKENIYTLDSKGELLITIMSSLAQEESRSISENVTWGKRKSFSDGKIYLPYANFLGYQRGKDGLPEIVPEEAETVRLIYRTFLTGKTPAAICALLEEREIPTPGGKKKWSQTTVRSILTNEKYKGDALLQKSFTVDFLTKKMKTNEGEIPQYYVEHSHPAIIPPEEWELVQLEIERRRNLPGRYSGTSVFASKLVCADCGGFYGRKIWHSNDRWRKAIWQCNHKFQNGQRCKTPHLDEETIQRMFLIAYNRFMGDREQLLADCALVCEKLSDSSELDAQLEKNQHEIENIEQLIRTCIRENAAAAQSQEEYQKRYNSLAEHCQVAYAKREKLEQERERRMRRDKELQIFIATLGKQPLVLEEWDELLWVLLVEKAIVRQDGSMEFTFKSGQTISVRPSDLVE